MELNKKIKTQRDLARGVIGDLVDQQRAYSVLTGNLSVFDAQLLAIEDERNEAIRTRLKAQDLIIAQKRMDLQLAKKARVNAGSLTDEENKRLLLLVAMSKRQEVNKGISSTAGEAAIQMTILAGDLNTELKRKELAKITIIVPNLFIPNLEQR